MSGGKNILLAFVLPLVRISLALPSTLCTSSSLSNFKMIGIPDPSRLFGPNLTVHLVVHGICVIGRRLISRSRRGLSLLSCPFFVLFLGFRI